MSSIIDVLHADVKPANVLVTRNSEGSLVAKLSDFGNAVQKHGIEYVRLPQSRPFNAPESTHREVTFEEARKQEIYCFGMSCLWILFHDRLQALEKIEVSDLLLKEDIHKQHQILFKYRIERNIENLIVRLVDQDTDLRSDQKLGLVKLLKSTLAFSLQDRTMSWDEAFECFQVER